MRKAFTMLEIIVTIAITTIVIGIVSLAIFNVFEGFSVVSKTANLQNNAILINAQYQELLKTATTATILPNAPNNFTDGNLYIYSTADNIYFREGASDEEELFVTPNSSETARFSRINDQTISVDFTLSESDNRYVLSTSTFMSNSTSVNGNTAGRCIVYSTTPETIPDEEEEFYLKEFYFEKSRNSRANMMGYPGYWTNGWTGLSNTPDDVYKGIINHETMTVDVYLPILRPSQQEYQANFLLPTVIIGGDKARYYTFNNTNSAAKKYDNNDATLPNTQANYVRFKESKSPFVGIRQIFVHSVSGEVKMYSIFVHYKDPSYISPTFTNLTIIPTEKGVKPTKFNTDFSDTSNYELDSTKIMMPTEGHLLNAMFKDATKSDYIIKWYTVDNKEDLGRFLNMSPSEKLTHQIASISNSRSLDLSSLPASKNPIGKYVFFGVMADYDNNAITYSIDGTFNEPNYINPYVYVQLDYRNMWETTLNEIDYFYSDSFKKTTIENAYTLSKPFANGYVSVNDGTRVGYSKFLTASEPAPFNLGATVNNTTFGIVSKNSYSNMTKSIRADFLTNKLDFEYIVSLKDKTLHIKGDRVRNSYWQNLDKFTASHYSFLSINPYDEFYLDKQVSTITSTGTVGLNISFKSDANSIGGISINPTASALYTAPALYNGFIEQFGSEGGRFDIIFNRKDISKGINDSTKLKDEDAGVKIVYGTTYNISDRDESTNKPIGASNINRPSLEFIETPYTFNELNKGNGLFINPNAPINFTFQFLGNSVSYGQSGKITALRLLNNHNNVMSNIMYFGEFKKAGSYYNSLFSSTFNDDKYIFSHNNGTYATVNGVINPSSEPSDYDVIGLYPSKDLFTSLFETSRKEVHISAWGSDSSMGSIDFTITEFRPLLQEDLTK